MEEKMNGFTSRIEDAMMRMMEEIWTVKRPNTIETYRNVIKEADKIVPTFDPPLEGTNLFKRVRALEFQMANVHDDVEDLNSEVTVIHADQAVQDERLLDVEDEMELVGRDVASLEENVNALDTSNAQLNQSVSELDVRVTTLESQNGTSDNVSDELDELSERINVYWRKRSLTYKAL